MKETGIELILEDFKKVIKERDSLRKVNGELIEALILLLDGLNRKDEFSEMSIEDGILKAKSALKSASPESDIEQARRTA